MIQHQPMRSVKAELTDWLDEDVVAYVIRHHEQRNLSYAVIAAELSRSGFMVTGKQLAGWVYQSKKKAK